MVTDRQTDKQTNRQTDRTSTVTPPAHARRGLNIYDFLLTQAGATPLSIASWNGHGGIVNILMRNGAGVNLAAEVYKIFLTLEML